MAYTKTNYADVDPVAEGLHFLREPLGCEHLGVSVLECPPGWTGKPHDHADEGHEEVYVLLEGGATVSVAGEPVPMEPGDALRIDPASSRRIENGDAASLFVLAGAP